VDQSLDWGAWAASRVSLKLGGRAGIPPLPGWLRGLKGWTNNILTKSILQIKIAI
jgi:hypothetical protein